MVRSLAVLLAAVSGLAACATLPEPVIVNPSWAEVPSGEDLSHAYPDFAVMIDVSGAARMRCATMPDGRLADCDVESVSPEGLGFEAAALELTPLFRVHPRQVDGEAAKGAVRFTIWFEMAPLPEPPSWSGPEPSPGDIARARPIAEHVEAQASSDRLATVGDLDPARRAAVETMIRTVDAGLRDRSIEAIAVSIARILSPAQLDSVLAGRGLAEPPPPQEVVEAADDQAFAVEAERTARLQALYCAAYPCVVKRVSDPSVPRVNERQPDSDPD